MWMKSFAAFVKMCKSEKMKLIPYLILFLLLLAVVSFIPPFFEEKGKELAARQKSESSTRANTTAPKVFKWIGGKKHIKQQAVVGESGTAVTASENANVTIVQIIKHRRYTTSKVLPSLDVRTKSEQAAQSREDGAAVSASGSSKVSLKQEIHK
ncbi:hypothetical protein [Geomonas ferrireducens]|uniref:hypothetical protein n=1 Tax=Geomonas ferrireducens TaxID=2570227 RepID=UPI0010A8C576|nr:hypothetical protein [Geomonas ferrireducens]